MKKQTKILKFSPTNKQVIPQMSVPPPMLAVPPPSMQSVEQIGTVTTPIVQQSTNIVSQSTPTMVTATPVQTIATPNQSQIIQQQTILQTPGGNMVIQQPVQTNLNVPPPTNLIPMKPTPPPVQLSQPPPNIQLQQPTQIVLNQPQTNYQYIQQATPADASQQQNSVTIQHIYQPQGQIVQQTQPINTFTTQQTRPTSQQYILQGNTA